MENAEKPCIMVYIAISQGGHNERQYSVGPFTSWGKASLWLHHFCRHDIPENASFTGSILTPDNEDVDEDGNLVGTTSLYRVTPSEAFRVVLFDFSVVQMTTQPTTQSATHPETHDALRNEEASIPSCMVNLPEWYVNGWRGFDLENPLIAYTAIVWAESFLTIDDDRHEEG